MRHDFFLFWLISFNYDYLIEFIHFDELTSCLKRSRINQFFEHLNTSSFSITFAYRCDMIFFLIDFFQLRLFDWILFIRQFISMNLRIFEVFSHFERNVNMKSWWWNLSFKNKVHVEYEDMIVEWFYFLRDVVKKSKNVCLIGETKSLFQM